MLSQSDSLPISRKLRFPCACGDILCATDKNLVEGIEHNAYPHSFLRGLLDLPLRSGTDLLSHVYTGFNIPRISSDDKIFRFDGGFVAVIHAMAVDTDGSAYAYHPQDLGTSYLCDGLDPYDEVAHTCDRDKTPGSRCFTLGQAAASQLSADLVRSPLPGWCESQPALAEAAGLQSPL